MDVAQLTKMRPMPPSTARYNSERHRFFKERGWIIVDEVLTKAEAAEARTEALRIMTEGTAYKTGTDYAAHHDNAEYARVAKKAMDVSRHSEIFRRIVTSPKLGALVKEVTGLTSIRLFGDQIILKMPESDEGIGTRYHQDYPHYPIDRGGGATVWIALTDLPAHAGTLRFIETSHRRGPLGRISVPDWLAEHPEDRELFAPPPALAAGSATIHDHLMVHGTDPNRWDQPRIGYMITYMPADALFNGMPTRWTEGLGLKINAPFDHEFFPEIG